MIRNEKKRNHVNTKNHFYGKYYKFISDDNFVIACIISHANEGDMLQAITPAGSFFIEDTTSVQIAI